MENDTFKFTGISSTQKGLVKALHFKWSNISFIPKESFTTFPNLERISIRQSLNKVDYQLLKNLEEFENKIKILDFYNNKIDSVDPQVWEIFKKQSRILFQENNICVNELIIIGPNISSIQQKLRFCFDNYIVKYGGSFLNDLKEDVGKLNNKVMKIEEFFEEFRNDDAKNTNNTQEMLEKILEILLKPKDDWDDPEFTRNNKSLSANRSIENPPVPVGNLENSNNFDERLSKMERKFETFDKKFDGIVESFAKLSGFYKNLSNFE